MSALLLVERIILESIAKDRHTLEEIVSDTDLALSFVEDILTYLVQKKILIIDDKAYFFNRERREEWLPLIKAESNIKQEINELLESLVGLHFSKDKGANNSFALKKVNLTEDEDKMFQTHLLNLDVFIKNIERAEKSKKNRGQTYKKMVLFWGHAQYSDLVENTLKLT